MMARAVPVGLVLILSLGGTMTALPVQARNSMTDNRQQTAPEMDIQQGTVGQVGGSRVGLASLATTAPPIQGAMPGATATLTIVGDTAGTHVETTLAVHERMVLPLADGMHRVEKLAPAGASDARGHVAIATAANGTIAPGTMFVAEGGRLRIGGPEVDSAIDLRIVQASPDSHAPKTATVEWLPAAYARADTPAAQIHQQSLQPGDQIQVGKLRLTVKAIEGRTQDHPCWIQFTASPAG
jgi:hypothetical protein